MVAGLVIAIVYPMLIGHVSKSSFRLFPRSSSSLRQAWRKFFLRIPARTAKRKFWPRAKSENHWKGRGLTKKKAILCRNFSLGQKFSQKMAFKIWNYIIFLKFWTFESLCAGRVRGKRPRLPLLSSGSHYNILTFLLFLVQKVVCQRNVKNYYLH